MDADVTLRDEEEPPINNRGSLLLFALLVVGIASMWMSAALTLSAVEHGASLRSTSLRKTFYVAEAGLDVAIQALRADANYAGVPYTSLGVGQGGYVIEVIPLGPDTRTMRVTGFYPSNNPAASGHIAKTIEVVVRRVELPGPGYGVVGDQAVRLEGSGNGENDDGVTVDSYDSRHGPYNAQAARANLRLLTNGHQEKAVAMVGGVTVLGDVVLGPGSNPATVLWRAPEEWTSIRGTVSVADTATPLEPVEMPALADGGRLVIGGQDVVTLPGGLYRFQDIQISGKGQLVFTGPAEVYVEEDVHISGGGIGTAGQLPPNLTLYVNGLHVLVSGDADLFAKIVAPNATIQISSQGDLYGAAGGREVVVSGQADFHYDEALNLYDTALNPPRSGNPLEVNLLSWRQVD